MSSPPTTLGKYQIIREIARSNDIVYEAYDPLMNRRVAVKELAVPGGSTSQQKDERLKRFLREAKAAGSLAHPNIVTIFEVGEDAGRHYLVMEYLDGHTLRNELDAKGFLPAEEAVKTAEAVLRALEYAHQNGVIHRDIKPENIQLLSDGRVKLTDFGIARLTFEPNLTMDGQVFGTPSYMSPEQVVGKEIDVRSDLFSVGVVLYEMLAGQKPFTGDSVVTITYAIMNKQPDQPAQVSYNLWQVVSKALDKTPAMRYANAPEMLKALDSAQRAPAPPPTQSYSQSGPQPTLNPYGPQGNPFTPQVPYPGGSYQTQNQPPLQYPYNPYQPQQQVPQNSNPYAPIQQPYSPGGQQYSPGPTYLPSQSPFQPSANPYQGTVPTYLPGAQNIPTYYPPPPRTPMMKPEQRALMWRIIATVLSIGTIFSLVIVACLSCSGAFKPPDAAPGNAVSPGSGTTDDSTPIDDSTSSNGPTLEKNGLDYASKARTESPDLAVQDLQNATKSLESAADAFKSNQQHDMGQKCLDEAADARYQWAILIEPEERGTARSILYEARKEASPGSNSYDEVDQEIHKLT
ncbi:MAG TPA: protein kinase [Fimbriimonadaceae bacterium]|jgi:serine/threonine-protein kinase